VDHLVGEGIRVFDPGSALRGNGFEFVIVVGVGFLGAGAILGHNYTCWLYFKGGKGIATSAGVLTALVPWALLIILSVWIVVLTFVIGRVFVSL